MDAHKCFLVNPDHAAVVWLFPECGGYLDEGEPVYLHACRIDAVGVFGIHRNPDGDDVMFIPWSSICHVSASPEHVYT